MNDDAPDNVRALPGGRLPADQVLRAHLGELDVVLVIGYAPDGGLIIASNIGTGAVLNLALDRAKRSIIDRIEAQDSDKSFTGPWGDLA